MPNLCQNRVTITGEPELLDWIAMELRGRDVHQREQDFDLAFSQILPIPEELKDREARTHWCEEHWGTRSGPWDPVLTHKEEALVYDFDTAWEEPEAIIVALSKKYPTTKVKHAFIEPGMMFGGLVLFENGTWIDGIESDELDELRQMSEWHTEVLRDYDEA